MKVNSVLTYALILMPFLVSCGEDDVPPEENEEELINVVRLDFIQGSSVVSSAEWMDPDGDGSQQPEIDTIRLLPGEEYELKVYFENNIEDSEDEGNITEEVEENAEDHQLFFSFTEDFFTSPAGDGNIDSSGDPVNYLDTDDNGLYVGLETEWTTKSEEGKGFFRVVLKLQPEIKSETSSVTDGVTEIDVTLPVAISN